MLQQTAPRPVENVDFLLAFSGLDRTNEVNRRACIQTTITCCVVPIGIALFIIGICAACGVMSGAAIGGCAIALSIPLLIGTVLMGRKDIAGNSRTLQMLIGAIVSVAYIVLGSLAIAGIIPPPVVGYVIVGVTVANLVASCIHFYCCGGQKALRQQLGYRV